eukprot:364072-Chlamydomonas_euryale.AAC.10
MGQGHRHGSGAWKPTHSTTHNRDMDRGIDMEMGHGSPHTAPYVMHKGAWDMDRGMDMEMGHGSPHNATQQGHGSGGKRNLAGTCMEQYGRAPILICAQQ